MMMTAVIDPTALLREHFENAQFRQNIEAFLWGILGNGALLVDSHGRIIDEVLKAAGGLGSNGKKASLLIEEIVKRKRSRVVCCGISSSGALEGLVCQLAEGVDADGLIVSSPSITLTTPCKTELILAADYLDSQFERRRRVYAENLPSLDRMSGTVRDEVFARCGLHPENSAEMR
jgi:hypothetical protein